VDSFIMSVDF